MRLADLEPRFVRYQIEGDRIFMPFVDTIGEAQGIEFLCPKCFEVNKGPVGTHAVICWSRSRNVPDDADPGPGRWKIEGAGFHDLTLNADPPGTARSVLLTGGCGWHGFITDGDVTST